MRECISGIRSAPYKLTLKNGWNNMEKESQKGECPMTILIGALCEGGDSIILLADKMTVLQPQSLVFGQSTKGIELTPFSFVLTAGMTSNYVFINAMKSSLNPQMSIMQIAELLIMHYRNFRLNKVASEVLALQGFNSFDEFHHKQKYLDGTLVGGLVEQARFYNLGVELILGGIDDTGHIFHIGNPGTYFNCDEPGFVCVGIGANRASPIFEFLDYSKDLSLSKVLSIVYLSKKRTEALSGIGESTDIWIVTKEEGIRKLSNQTLLKLEEMNSSTKTNFSAIYRDIEIEEQDISYL